MILKVIRVQPIFNDYKHDPQKPKEGLKRKIGISFANILENTIRSQSTSG
jgi:hypothetical protein